MRVVCAVFVLASVATTVACDASGGEQVSDDESRSLQSMRESGSLVRRWSVPVDGELIWLVAADEQVYAVTQRDGALDVASIGVTSGDQQWDVTVAERADDVWAAPTGRGLMITYDVPSAAHLALLDAENGDADWDVALEHSAYDVYGEVIEGIGVMDVSEGETAFVDLDTGERVSPGDEAWSVIGDEIATLEGSVLRVGQHPFDDETPVREIELPFVDVVAGGEDPTGTTLVVAREDEVVGLVDGQEQWRWRPDLEPIIDVAVTSQHVGASAASGDMLRPQRWQFARIDGEFEVSPFEELPPQFDLKDAVDFDEGRSLLVGTIDEGLDGAFTGERFELAVVELTDQMVIHRSASPVDSLGETGFFGPYVFHASGDDAWIDVYDAVELTAVSRLSYPDGSQHAVLGDALAVYDAGAGTVSLYAWSGTAPTAEHSVPTVVTATTESSDLPEPSAPTSSVSITAPDTVESTTSALPPATLPPTTLVDINSLTVGQCLLGAELVDGDIGSGVMQVVDCAVPHHAEVFHISRIDTPVGTPYPADDEVRNTALSRCHPAFDAYVGRVWAESRLGFTYVYPYPAEWDANDRTILCYLWDRLGRTLTGSMAGSGQ